MMLGCDTPLARGWSGPISHRVLFVLVHAMMAWPVRGQPPELGSAVTLFVHPSRGSDASSGLMETEPLRTLSAAATALRNLMADNRNRSVVVQLGAGEHRAPLLLDDRHTPHAPHRVIWRGVSRSGFAAPPATRISGAVNITGWRAGSRPNQFVASFPSGLSDTRQVYFDGVRGNRSRVLRGALGFPAGGLHLSADGLGYIVGSAPPPPSTCVEGKPSPVCETGIDTQCGMGKTICSCHADGHPMSFDCGNGTISAVLFASIGSPTGKCGNYAPGNCSGDPHLATAFISKTCVGKRACEVPTDIDYLNDGKDPCAGVPKRTAVQVECTTSQSTPPPAVVWQPWADAASVEMVYNGKDGGSSWAQSRCGVQNISDTGAIVMQQPCFHNGRTKPFNQAMTYPTWLENSAQWINRSGDFSVDRIRRLITVQLAPGATPENVALVAAGKETLLRLVDVRGHVFEGIAFEFATWLEPSTGTGYIELQASARLVGTPEQVGADLQDDSWRPADGNVQLRSSSEIAFIGCWFHHLGGCGVSSSGGSANVTIENNTFVDISASAVSIGNTSEWAGRGGNGQDKGHMKLDPVNRDVVFRRNVVHDVAVEYSGAPGVIYFYSVGARIEHNEIYNLPYSGISLGWGWDREVAYGRDNHVTGNLIHHILLKLWDGGFLYTIGNQPNSTVSGNYGYDQEGPFGCFYFDSGATGFTITDNVAENCSASAVFFNHGNADLYVSNLWWRNAQPVRNDCVWDPKQRGSGPFWGNCTVDGTTTMEVKPGAPWPAAAQAVIDAAGTAHSRHRMLGSSVEPASEES